LPGITGKTKHDPTTDNNAIKPHPKHVLPTEDTAQRHRDDGTGSTSNISKVHTLRAPCQKDANKKKVTQTIKNDERTAKTYKNTNGNLEPKSQRKTSTHDDDKENQSIKPNQNKRGIHH